MAAGVVLAVWAPAGMARGTGPEGSWTGLYTCGQGVTALRLEIEDAGSADVRGVFAFGATPDNPTVPTGCFAVSGRFDPATGHLALLAGRWILKPAAYVTVDLDGTVDGDRFRGTVIGPGCERFELHRADKGVPLVAASCASDSVVASSGR